MSKLRSDANYPDHATVLRIATQEAEAACAQVADVLSMSRGGRASMARRRAMVRILIETGCSDSGLAVVWDCDRQVVTRLRDRLEPPPRPVYDPDTLARLNARHGPERTALIATGRDYATIADIAAWRALGSGRGETA